MGKILADKILSVEEYIQFELTAERRHEFINGKLHEMPGEKDINNEIALLIAMFFVKFLNPNGYQTYINDVKVAITGENKFYYPDVFITKEPKTTDNQFIKYQPEMIVEVLSPSTHITDTVDKYLDYTKIPSLHYYMLVEPETVYITLYSRNAEGKWQAQTFLNKMDTIELPALHISIPVNAVYEQV